MRQELSGSVSGGPPLKESPQLDCAGCSMRRKRAASVRADAADTVVDDVPRTTRMADAEGIASDVWDARLNNSKNMSLPPNVCAHTWTASAPATCAPVEQGWHVLTIAGLHKGDGRAPEAQVGLS